jgi:hypothetical protein
MVRRVAVAEHESPSSGTTCPTALSPNRILSHRRSPPQRSPLTVCPLSPARRLPTACGRDNPPPPLPNHSNLIDATPHQQILTLTSTLLDITISVKIPPDIMIVPPPLATTATAGPAGAAQGRVARAAGGTKKSLVGGADLGEAFCGGPGVVLGRMVWASQRR